MIPRPNPVPTCTTRVLRTSGVGVCGEEATGETDSGPRCDGCLRQGDYTGLVRRYAEAEPAPVEAPGGQPERVWREAEAGANSRPDVCFDEVEAMRMTLAVLDRLAREASWRAGVASAAAVAGREHNLATELWRAARAIERVVGTGED